MIAATRTMRLAALHGQWLRGGLQRLRSGQSAEGSLICRSLRIRHDKMALQQSLK
jgi:hypothetical protein